MYKLYINEKSVYITRKLMCIFMKLVYSALYYFMPFNITNTFHNLANIGKQQHSLLVFTE